MKYFYKKTYFPLFISNLLTYFVFMMADMVDSVLAGNMIGESAVAAVSLSTPLYTLICFVGYLFAEGAPIIYQRKYGALKTKEAYGTFSLMLIANLILGAVFAVAFLFFYKPFLLFYGAGPEITALSVDYLKYFAIIAFLYPFYGMIYNMVFLDGDSRLCLISTTVQMVVNIVVSYLLISSIGIVGLGLGTTTSIVVSIAILMIHFLKKTNSVRFSLEKIDFKDIPLSISTGSYMSLLYLLSMVEAVIINKYIITTFGEVYLPAYSCMMFALSLALNYSALAVATGPLFSIYYGENNYYGIKRMVKYISKLAIIIGVVSFVVIEIFADLVPVIYGITTPKLVEISVIAVRIVSISFIIIPFHDLLKIYYSYIGKTGLSTFFALMTNGVIAVTLELGISSIIGINGIWVGQALAPFATIVLAFIYIIIVFKKDRFPFIVKESEEVYMFDDYISPESTIAIRDAVGSRLNAKNLPKKLVNRIELLIEEMLVQIQEKNPGKRILTEVTLMIGEDIRIIEKDTGIIFDITDTDSNITSFSAFILSSLMEREKDRMYTVTTGYNRNTFSFSAQEVNQ